VIETDRQRGFREGIEHAKSCMRDGAPGFRCESCKATTAEVARLQGEVGRLKREAHRVNAALKRVREAVKEQA
jgi:hypothetical protein